MQKKDPNKLTPFEERVYAATKCVPRGKVTTYKHLAQSIGCGSSQAIGQALKCNPYAPKVPCHRVIRSDLTIGGFAGHTQGPEISRKIRLLAGEGVKFEHGRLADPSKVHTF